jgi:predicted SnoaL-like aldol condensation-catalyzing enzyme
MGNKNSSIKRNLANKNPYNYNKIDNIKQQHQVGATLNSKDLTVDQYEQLCNLTKLNKDFIKKMFTVFINDYPMSLKNFILNLDQGRILCLKTFVLLFLFHLIV